MYPSSTRQAGNQRGERNLATRGASIESPEHDRLSVYSQSGAPRGLSGVGTPGKSKFAASVPRAAHDWSGLGGAQRCVSSRAAGSRYRLAAKETWSGADTGRSRYGLDRRTRVAIAKRRRGAQLGDESDVLCGSDGWRVLPRWPAGASHKPSVPFRSLALKPDEMLLAGAADQT